MSDTHDPNDPVERLRHLSRLLDQALGLTAPEQADWLSSLQGPDAALAPALRELLARQGSIETGELLDGAAVFTVPRGGGPGPNWAAGDAVGPYRLLRAIGQGGMGEVWLAERADGQLKRQVALKLPMLGLRRDVLVQRFARERDILAGLVHPHIARLYDAGLAENGQPYLALEYVAGQSITAHVQSHQSSLRQRVQLMRQAMAAVQYAHANLVIHRDLKPPNVLVGDDGVVKLLDFGIAKLLADDQTAAEATELTGLGGRALTLAYAAPEQIAGSAISTGTDIYALGVLLYELLTGERPFGGDRRALEEAILHQPAPRPPGVPPDLAVIVQAALRKEPAQRYVTVAAFSDDLERWLQGLPVQARTDSRWYRFSRFVGRNRSGVAAGTVVALALVAAVAVSLWEASIARREARTAQAVEAFLLDIFRANSSAQGDPEAARRTTARELLDIGAKRIDSALADAPQARSRVLQTLITLYDDLTLAPQSLALLRQRVALLREIEGRNSVALAQALTQLGARAAESNAVPESEAAFAEALLIVQRRGDEQTPASGELALERAQALMNRRDPAAGPLAQQAVDILRQHPPSKALMGALSTRAFIVHDRHDGGASSNDSGIADMREALDIGRQIGDDAAERTVEVYLELSRLQNDRYEISASGDSLRRAYELALRREGPESHLTLNAALEWATLYFNNGEYQRVAQSLAVAVPAAERRLAAGDRTWLPLLVLATAAGAQVRSGNFDSGLQTLQRLAQAQDILGANPPVETYLQFMIADGLALRGDTVAAALALEAGRRALVKAGVQDEAREMWEWRYARLRVAVLEQDAAAAGPLIAATHLLDVPAQEHPNAALRRLVRLLEAQWAAGQPEAALASATALLQALPRSPDPAFDGDRERRAALVAGLARLQAGHPAQALPLLRRAIALAEGRLDVTLSPQHAHALIASGRALQSLGQAEAARRAAQQAAAILARHPHLHPHHAAALKALQRQLAASPG